MSIRMRAVMMVLVQRLVTVTAVAVGNRTQSNVARLGCDARCRVVQKETGWIEMDAIKNVQKRARSNYDGSSIRKGLIK